MVTSQLHLLINGETYRMKFLSPHPSLAVTAWSLEGPRSTYNVRLTPEMVAECECGDFVHRKANRGLACRHIIALQQVHLLPS